MKRSLAVLGALIIPDLARAQDPSSLVSSSRRQMTQAFLSSATCSVRSWIRSCPARAWTKPHQTQRWRLGSRSLDLEYLHWACCS